MESSRDLERRGLGAAEQRRPSFTLRENIYKYDNPCWLGLPWSGGRQARAGSSCCFDLLAGGGGAGFFCRICFCEIKYNKVY